MTSVVLMSDEESRKDLDFSAFYICSFPSDQKVSEMKSSCVVLHAHRGAGTENIPAALSQ